MKDIRHGRGSMYREKHEMKKYIKEGRTEGNEEIKEEIRNGKGKMYRNKECDEEIHKERRTEGKKEISK